LKRLSEDPEFTFLGAVVIPMMDADGDNAITETELLSLHMMSMEFASIKMKGEQVDSWPKLLDAIFFNFDQESFKKLPNDGIVPQDLIIVTGALQVRNMVL